jgi:DNA helicase-2/ATP-dependent DNA helicase PcrA
MSNSDLSLLSIEGGLVIAPAGCGKTELIANALRDHKFEKPILVLTHTNSGVAALRGRLDKAGVKPSAYRLSTIDGWAIRLISTFPLRSGYDTKIVEGQRPNYPAIREAAWNMLKAGHISDVVAASYSRLLVDEYQDCSLRQHAIVYCAATILPTCVVGDPVQAIFGFGDDALADWDNHVCEHFPCAGELTHPWRWVNADAEELGQWLLNVRKKLLAKEPIDLSKAPAAVSWVQLDGTQNDHAKLLQAGRVRPPGGNGSVLIIGESTNPASQQRFASQTSGAVTVEAVDLRDLVTFARTLDLAAPNALQTIAEFAEKMMTNVGANDLVQRVDIISRGTGRKEPSDVERSAIAFQTDRTHHRVMDLIVEINKDAGVRVFRPAVLRACLRALELCCGPDKMTLQEAAIRVREQGRVLGRSLPRRAVGSTLLLKGLEAEVAVILNADGLDARNLYVAMTRGSKQLIICGRNSVLQPKW